MSKAGGCLRRQRTEQRSDSVLRTAACSLFVAVGILVCGLAAFSQVTGQFGLDILARRIPTTLTPSISLDTPSEFSMLEFGIASKLDLHVNLDFYSFTVNAGTNMAGPEHFVVIGNLGLKDLNSYGLSMDEFSLSPEIWFAVPFESVVDVNSLPNSDVIPPGDPLFVALRVRPSCSYGAWNATGLLMFEDYNFPDPTVDFVPLDYDHSDQGFAWGSLTTVSWSGQLATLTSVTAIWATSGQTSVKGWSAVGRVSPGSLSETLSIAGLSLGDLCAGVCNFYDSELSLSATFTGTAPGCSCTITTQTPSGTICWTARLIDVPGPCPEQATVSACLTLFATPMPQVGGITLSFTFGSLQGSLSLNNPGLFGVNSLSFSGTTELNLVQGMRGTFGLNLTGLESGLTGVTARLALSQGLFSAGTAVTFAQIGTAFGFASLTTQVSFRLPPGVISVQATFAHNGLTQASFSVGVVF